MLMKLYIITAAMSTKKCIVYASIPMLKISKQGIDAIEEAIYPENNCIFCIAVQGLPYGVSASPCPLTVEIFIDSPESVLYVFKLLIRVSRVRTPEGAGRNHCF
ncbi:hypothetical protein ACTQXY_05010 [Faecalimonas sp. LCP19S3_D12]